MPSTMNNKNKMYEFEKIAIVVALVLAALIIGLVIFATRDSGRPSAPGSVINNSDQSDNTSEDISNSTVVPGPTPSDEKIDFVSISWENSKLNDGALVLVNRDHKYTVDVSSKLKNLYNYNSEIKYEKWYNYYNLEQHLTQDVANALNDMDSGLHAAYSDKKTTFTVMKTFVDAETQQKKYESESQNATAADKAYLQAGGYSEHQTGLAFDIKTADEDSLAWLVENCWRYGFVYRYPEGKESITYVKNETGHFRYVGVSHALYMKLNKLVLEEYLVLLEGKNHTARLKLDVGTGDKYETYACKAAVGATTEIMVPAEDSGWGYTVSGTNNGYFVVTIYKLQA